MKRKTPSSIPASREPDAASLRTVSENGKAPDSRLRNASQGFEVALQLDRADKKRRAKRARIYKAYNRFPPTQYSKLAKDGQEWQSNVNWGMLSFIIDNNLASFYDMITERTEAAQISTKKGNAKEKREWSEKISIAFNLALERWDDFLLNQEQDILDMLLYGRGIEMWEDLDGFQSRHVSADNVLVPDGTKVNLDNPDTLVVKWEFKLHELYEAIQDQDAADDMGWNVEAVVEAMRWRRDSWKRYKTASDFLHAVKEGNITITSHLKETVSAYIVFIREYSGKISKHIVLQDYAPLFSLTRGKIPKEDSEAYATKVDEVGFLFTRTGMFDSFKNAFAVFLDNAGSGMWHNTPSLAEKIFVQCRQYDFAMNAIMDAVKLNMTLILQGSTADATQKLQELVLGPYTILPADVAFSQHRIELPTAGATQALQFMMLDMNRGIGNYRIHEKGSGGEAPTATQSQLDATEAAKLTGTQLRRFNSQHTIYYKELYRRLTLTSPDEKGYEIFKEFKDYLTENQVPEEAWNYDNIHSIKSNMLSGAGSPSFKLMAAQQTIQFTNITPKDEGQANAVRDAIAALQGRDNVDRYLPKSQRPDPTWNERIIGFENESFESPVCNPQNIMVYPTDNHIEHIKGHQNDMARTLQLCQQAMEQGKPSKDEMQAAATKLLNGGGHVNAHMEQLAKDQGKQDMLKEFAKNMQVIQRQADQLAQQFQEMQKKQGDDAMNNLDSDPEVRKAMALAQIQIDTKQKLAGIQIGGAAQKHALRLELDREKAGEQIAIDRAKAASQLQSQAKARRTKKQ
jgi:hypothetical protein